MKYSFVKALVIIGLLILNTFYTVPVISASITENFNGSYSHPSAWIVSNSEPGLTFSSDFVSLSANSPRTFPYVRSAYPIILADDNSIEFMFKYDYLSSNFGTGLAVTDVNPPLGEPLLYPSMFSKYTMFYVWQSANNPYLHIVTFLCPNGDAKCTEGYPLRISETSAPDYKNHVVRIVKQGFTYSLYLDDVHIFTSLPTIREAKNFWFGNPEKTSTNGGWSSFSVNYLKITNSTQPIFPYLSQLDPLWGDEEYDSAESWAGMEASGIDRWGCALTSAAMVLQNYGVKSTSDKLIDPGELNRWLKTQKDGYVGLGLINWIAVSRYVREQYNSGLAPTKLEFERSYLPTAPVMPSIFDLGGHFVVAHDSKDLNWLINDPNNIERTELAMTTPVKSINRFVPSETDLSYILLTLSPDVVGVLKNEAGDLVELNWINEYIDSDIGESQSPVLKTAMLPKPADGKYYLHISNPSENNGEAKIYLYDELANEEIPETYPLTNSDLSIEIDYESEVGKTRTSAELDTTPPQTPSVISPQSGLYVNTAGLVLDWSDVTDPSSPVTYNYRSTNSSGSVYGPVSTGTQSYINAPNTPDNTYIWQVQACDRVGNCSEWSTSTLIVDSTSPSTPFIIKPVEDEYFRNTPIVNEWSKATDNNAVDYYRIQYEYDDLHKFAGYPYRTTTLTSRSHTPNINEQGGVSFRVQAIDRAGNESEWSDWRHYTYDATIPTLIGPPTTIFLTNSPTQIWIWMAGADTHSGIAGYSTRTYDNLSGTYLSDWLWLGKVLGTTTSLDEGLWNLELKARDLAGNESAPLISNRLNVDLTPPETPALLKPENNAAQSGDYLLNDWSDSEGASKYIYESYDDSQMKNLRFRQEYSESQKSASKVGDGEIWWRVQAQDLAGNKSEWSPLFKVTIDNTKPLIFLNAWGSTIDGTAKDNLSGINRVEIKIYKPSQSEVTVQASGTTNWSYTMSEAPFGPYRITVAAYDNAGNVSEEIVKTFVMSPAVHQTGSPKIAGATTRSESKPPVAKNTTNEGRKLVNNHTSPSPKAENQPSSMPEGVVLGESTEVGRDPNDWWLITGLLTAGSLIFVLIFSLARKI